MKNETTNNLNHKPYNWRLLGILVIAVLLSVILITPYSLTLQGNALNTSKLPMPLTVLIPLQWLQTTLLYGILAAIGLFIANRIGLGLPFLESWLAGKPEWERVRKFALPAVIAGILAAIVIIVLDSVVFGPLLSVDLKRSGITIPISALVPPAWQGFLASFYGGTTEEILLRLFMLSLFAWIGRFLNHTPDGRPGEIALWAANILAAILFGIGHLPATAAAGLPMDTLVITRAIVLNGLAGLVFGWFYWKHGLEAAMVSHFSGDIILHVIMPLISGH
jgi:hypothetical protein